MNSNQEILQGTRSYLRFASCCAFITVFTTIAIHNIHVPAGTFEEQVFLYRDKSYLLQHWIIMFHCLMVLFSMLGIALVIKNHSPALAVLGFVFFCLFVFSEWERTLNVLWHINGLRSRYLSTIDSASRQSLQFEIQNRLFQSNTFFLLFTIGFSLGNACYGACLWSNKGPDRYLAAGLLFWCCCTSVAFVYDFYPAKWMDVVIRVNNIYYQPVIRFAITCWLYIKTRKMAEK